MKRVKSGDKSQAICDACGSTVSIPHQSSFDIKEQLNKDNG